MSQIYTYRDGTYKIAKDEKKKVILAIRTDDVPDDPRTWDNLGKMVCFHNKYKLGDQNHDYHSEDYQGWEELREAIEKNEETFMILPLYLYDHSGITISTKPFGSQWDSGQVGWIFVTKKEVEKNWPIETIVGEGQRIVRECLEAEVKLYDQYLRGDIYEFILEDSEGNMIDSCSSFFGDDFKENGMAEHLGDYAYLLDKLEDP